MECIPLLSYANTKIKIKYKPSNLINNRKLVNIKYKYATCQNKERLELIDI